MRLYVTTVYHTAVSYIHTFVWCCCARYIWYAYIYMYTAVCTCYVDPYQIYLCPFSSCGGCVLSAVYCYYCCGRSRARLFTAFFWGNTYNVCVWELSSKGGFFIATAVVGGSPSSLPCAKFWGVRVEKHPPPPPHNKHTGSWAIQL